MASPTIPPERSPPPGYRSPPPYPTVGQMIQRQSDPTFVMLDRVDRKLGAIKTLLVIVLAIEIGKALGKIVATGGIWP